MTSFEVKILTPERETFDGTAEKITIRTSEGDIGVFARHINYVAALGIGQFMLEKDGSKRYAALADGFISVTDGNVSILTDYFEWADEIDAKRAEKAKEFAEGQLGKSLDEMEHKLMEVKLKKALNRISVSGI